MNKKVKQETKVPEPYVHRNFFENVGLFLDIHKLTSFAIYTPKRVRSGYILTLNKFIECLSTVFPDIPIYVITSSEKNYWDMRGGIITNNAPENSLALSICIHSKKEFDICNMKQQWCYIDIQKNKTKKKGFGIVSYLFCGITYEEWLDNQLNEYQSTKHHLTKEELFKECPLQ